MTERLGLTPEEDAELRRLVYLDLVGQLDPLMRERVVELRRRDRRNVVRQVEDDLRVIRGGGEEGPSVPAQRAPASAPGIRRLRAVG